MSAVSAFVSQVDDALAAVPVGRSEPELDFRGAVINDPLPAPPAMTPPQK